MTRVVLVDDHPIVRKGLRTLLEEEGDCQVIGEAEGGLAAIDLVLRLRPDVAILDVRLPDVSGLEVARQIRERTRDIRVIMLSMHADEPYVLEALRQGVSGYVLKNAATADLVTAVRAAVAGRRFLSAPLSEGNLDAYARRALESERPFDRYQLLTSREREVLHLAAQGLNSAEVAERLAISSRTAEGHRANMLRKLGLQNQTDLVRFAISRGLIEVEG